MHEGERKWWYLLTSNTSVVLTFICLLGLVIAGKNFGCFPLQYIPTKWSDFNCIQRTFTLIQDHYEEIQYMTPSLREINLRGNIVVLVLLVAGMLVLLWVLEERRKMKSVKV